MKQALAKGINAKAFKFDLPNIADMLIYHNGTICKKCRMGFYCTKHKLVKKEKQVDFDEDNDFDRA